MLSVRQKHCLRHMGVDIWVPLDVMAKRQADVQSPTVAEALPVIRSEQEQGHAEWQDLRAQVNSCTDCALHKGRTQTVFGIGNINAEWMLIGEAPGAEEDRQGEPFVGPAGQLLDAMLAAMGLSRPQVYIANILKCRPPNNRDPQPEEASACREYLQKQIAWVQPSIILALGRVAAQNLLQTSMPVGKLRGQRHRYSCQGSEYPLVVTWHPAYLLRKLSEKRGAWEDLKMAMTWHRECSGH
ncbi:MAG: uracil-DNA glycosylase [Candidatus Eutrophobiaceae bacterium]